MDFHPWKSTIELILMLPKQHYNYPKHSCQVCSGWGRLATSPHPYKPLRLYAGPLPHRQVTKCVGLLKVVNFNSHGYHHKSPTHQVHSRLWTQLPTCSSMPKAKSSMGIKMTHREAPQYLFLSPWSLFLSPRLYISQPSSPQFIR